MALQASGAISLSEIQTEHGGVYAASLSEYYLDADPSLVSSNNTGVPNIGSPISFSDFYSTVQSFVYAFTASAQEINLSTHLVAQGWNGSSAVNVTVNSGVYIWSDDTSTAALTIPATMTGGVTITNNGYIIGKGGQGGYRADNATDGGPAISNSATGVVLTNASGAFIAGGGGGGAGSPDKGGDDAGHGGGGAGGGRGGGQLTGRLGGAGGAIGQEGSDGGTSFVSGTAAQGGGAGGGGGGADASDGQGGGGGGRILPGTGGAGGLSVSDGGAGGSAGNAGSDQVDVGGGGGGGGWGASGGDAESHTGGSGGAAISGTSITVTNNGTIYGSQA